MTGRNGPVTSNFTAPHRHDPVLLVMLKFLRKGLRQGLDMLGAYAAAAADQRGALLMPVARLGDEVLRAG